MAEYLLTNRAEQDLADIVKYTQNNWGKTQTKIYLNLIEAKCEKLAKDPASGKNCDYLADGLMSFNVRSHVIYYKRHNNNISIIRILHNRMLPNKHI